MSKKRIDDIEIEYEDDEEKKKPSFIRRFIFTLILVIILLVIYARYIGITGLIVKEYPVYNSNITDTINGLKIAHFSDLLYGSTTDISMLKKLVKEINLTKPDIVVFTGDLVSKNKELDDNEINKLITQLSKIESTYGKYYVTGDSDEKLDKYYEIMDSSSFTKLDDTYDIIYLDISNTILISGLSTSSNTEFLDSVINENSVNYKINIMHYPDKYDDIKEYNYDLVLAGHSLNGQVVIPFYGGIFKYSNSKNYYKPYYKIDNTDFYISSGIGVIDYNYRFLNRPSFNLYRLIKE